MMKAAKINWLEIKNKIKVKHKKNSQVQARGWKIKHHSIQTRI